MCLRRYRVHFFECKPPFRRGVYLCNFLFGSGKRAITSKDRQQNKREAKNDVSMPTKYSAHWNPLVTARVTAA